MTHEDLFERFTVIMGDLMSDSSRSQKAALDEAQEALDALEHDARMARIPFVRPSRALLFAQFSKIAQRDERVSDSDGGSEESADEDGSRIVYDVYEGHRPRKGDAEDDESSDDSEHE